MVQVCQSGHLRRKPLKKPLGNMLASQILPSPKSLAKINRSKIVTVVNVIQIAFIQQIYARFHIGKQVKHLYMLGCIFVLNICLFAYPAAAERYVEQYGKAVVDMSYFWQKPAYTLQEDRFAVADLKPGLLVEDGGYEFVFEPRLTTGQIGKGRVDFTEAHISRSFDQFDVQLGNNVEFWGKTESFNPVDVLSSYDYSRGLMRGVKLGTMMVKLSAPLGDGQIDGYVLPRFSENIYPSLKSRQRPALKVNNQNETYSAGAKRSDMGKALRWTGYFGNVDLGLSYVSAIGNAPRLLPQADGSLTADYSAITQYGLDIQYLMGDTALKAELIDRDGQYNRVGVAERYTAAVFGIERSIYGVAGGDYDLVALAEFATDSRQKDSHTGFQNDLVGGFRLLFNDIDDSELLILVTRDLDYKAQTMRASYNTRLSDSLSVQALVSTHNDLAKDVNNSIFAQDKYANLSLTYSW